MNIEHLKTDVLIVGGGMAGWMAADHARRSGADVIVADKGYIGKSGQSPYATGIYNYDSEKGRTVKEVADFAHHCGEYLTNRYWSELIIRESSNIINELKTWGFGFAESLYKGGTSASLTGSPSRNYLPYDQTYGCRARAHLKEMGVHLMDRVMITELIVQDKRAAGAVGISADSENVFCIEAGAVILCTGAAGMRAPGYSCVACCTGDGDRMAYEAGARVAGKEFVQPFRATLEMPSMLGGRALKRGDPMGTGRVVKGVVDQTSWLVKGEPHEARKGRLSSYKFSYLDLELLLYEGNGPAIIPESGYHVTSGAGLGMSVRKSEGVWPSDHECSSDVEGLFAAGDSLATMQNGALYQLGGGAICGCAVTGAIAGDAAAKHALKNAKGSADELNINRAINMTVAPYERKSGYSASWIIHQIQNAYSPYYVAYIKKEDRLNAALTNIMYISDALLPKVMATDMHELRLAHEARSIAMTTELRLRSALFRTESRGMHFREDYPYRDDENWLAWTTAGCEDGRMILEKEPVPMEWRPQAELSYAEKYPYAFPGEAERGLR